MMSSYEDFQVWPVSGFLNGPDPKDRKLGWGLSFSPANLDFKVLTKALMFEAGQAVSENRGCNIHWVCPPRMPGVFSSLKMFHVILVNHRKYI